MAWGKNGSTTLSGSSDTLAITGMTASKTNQFMSHHIGGSGNINILYTLNNDSGSRYASRGNSGSEWTSTSEPKLFAYYSSSNDYDTFNIFYSCFVVGEEKLIISNFVDIGGSGNGNAPYRGEAAGKYVPSDLDDTITSIDTYNGTTGDFTTGSNISALGSDMTPTAAVPFPSDVPTYSRFEETDTRKIYTKGTYGWTEMGTAPESRGIFSGSNGVIDYINIATLGNATDFGDLTSNRPLMAVSNATRGVFAGGTGIIDYITIATPSNATDFGDLTQSRNYGAGVSNSTRGVFAGGTGITNIMDYITVATTGNAIDFGDLTVSRTYLAGCSNSTRGVFGGGFTGGNNSESRTIDYITIATTGNATNFGWMTQLKRMGDTGVANATRGVFAGGRRPAENPLDDIDYITIATTGNATNFGNLTVARNYAGGLSNSTRGVFAGGGTRNVMDYITIDTTGNASDFGDLTTNRTYMGGLSDYVG